MSHRSPSYLVFFVISSLLPPLLSGCGGGAPSSDATSDGAPAPSAAATVQEEIPLEVTAADAPEEDASEEDAKWGDLQMQFIFGGVAPNPQPIALAATDDYCSRKPVLSDALLVDQETGGLANVFVSLHLGRGETVESHPLYETIQPNALVNRDCRFKPHALFHVAGQPLKITNADKTAHNANANFGSSRNRSFNETIAAGGTITRDGLDDPVRWPTKVSCSMHTWMAAYVLIQDHPYGAVSNTQGQIVIRNLPVGQHTLQIWHEGTGELSEIEVDGQAFSWRKGRVQVNIKPGVNTAPVITVPASAMD